MKELEISWRMSHLKRSHYTRSLREHIIDVSILAVNDGSYYPHSQVGAYAWIISSPDDTK